MEAGGFVALIEQLRSVRRKCQAQQERLRQQKSRLRVQQLTLIGTVITVVPDESSNDSGSIFPRWVSCPRWHSRRERLAIINHPASRLLQPSLERRPLKRPVCGSVRTGGNYIEVESSNCRMSGN